MIVKVLYLDNIIETEGLGSPYKKITLQSDTNRIFNIIRDSGGIAEVRDEDEHCEFIRGTSVYLRFGADAA